MFIHVQLTPQPLDDTSISSNPTNKGYIQIQESHTVVPSARKRLFQPTTPTEQTIQPANPPDQTASFTSDSELIGDPEKGKGPMETYALSKNNPASELTEKRKEDTTSSG